MRAAGIAGHGLGLADAGLELDRVVHRQSHQHRQDGDRGHRQGRPDERQAAEGERRGEPGERQRQQAGALGEDQHERGGHHQGDRHQQQQDRVGELARQVRDDHRPAGDEIALAVGQVPLGHRHGLAHERDRAVALGLGEPGLHAHRHERRFAPGEQVGELRSGRAGGLVGREHERGDEVRVLQARLGGHPVLERERDEPLLEAGHPDFAGRAASSLARAAPSPLARAAWETTWAAWAAWASALLVWLDQLLVDHFGGLVDERAGTEARP